MSGFDGTYYQVDGINPIDGSHVHGMPRTTAILDLLAKPALIQWAANEAAKKTIEELRKVRKRDPRGIAIPDDDAIYDIARFMYRELSTDAKNIGTLLHDNTERHNHHLYSSGVTGYSPVQPSEYDDYGLAESSVDIESMMDRWMSDWIAFCTKANLKPLHIEKIVIGPGYAGTVDLVAECDYIWFLSRDKTFQKEQRERRIVALFDFKTGKDTNYNETWSMQTAAYRHGLEQKGIEIDTNCAIRFNKNTQKMARVADYGGTYGNDLERFFCLRDYWWRTKFKGE